MPPNYFTTRLTDKFAGKKTRIKVQQYHAHIVIVRGEYEIEELVIRFSFDGTGFETDYKIWEE